MSNDIPWQTKYAFYAASLYKLGHFIDAGMVSALLFDRYLDDEFARHPKLQRHKGRDYLTSAIDELCKIDRDKYNYTFLHKLRTIRNKRIIHPEYQINDVTDPVIKNNIKEDIESIVKFTWKTFDPEGYKKHRSIRNIPVLDADYAVTEIRELLQDDSLVPEESTTCRAIYLKDFKNLYLIRNKLLQFGQYAKEHLLDNFKNLDVDIISKVDTTSAYVWFAINLHKGTPEGRDRISGASASILATPLDLRIYMDFGGEAVEDRKDYYTFLESHEYRDFVNSYKSEELYLFDIDWYCFITNRNLITLLSDKSLTELIISAREELDVFEKKDNIITWNRNLLGYVLERRDVKFSEIIQKLEVIIKLYYYFMKYCNAKRHRKYEFPWMPKNDYILDIANSCLKKRDIRLEAYNEEDY